MDENFAYLAERFQTDKITAEERKVFDSMVESGRHDGELETLIEFWLQQEHEASNTEVKQAILHQLKEKIQPGKVLSVRHRVYLRWSAAAAILILITSTLFYLNSGRKKDSPAIANVAADLKPGHAGAILILSNGKRIVLDSAAEGQLANENGVVVVKGGNSVDYSSGADNGAVVYNTMQTPKGRSYALTLSDGSKVWLNAESTIRFPTTFTGKERVVEITGEAYFEVVHNSKQPFRVMTRKETINDLGTKFNVNAYDNEGAVKTTLLEGAVKIEDILLKPGEQYESGKVSPVNTDKVIAWVNGQFSFERADIATIMRQVERWYGVRTEYQRRITEKFYADVPRNTNVSTLLKILEATGAVKFEIYADKIVVK
jgi:transmembrane sensor